jgi:hypothetical protein
VRKEAITAEESIRIVSPLFMSPEKPGALFCCMAIPFIRSSCIGPMISLSHRNGFTGMQTNPVYSVSNLSNRRLWEIIRHAEQRVARDHPALVAQARAELFARNQYSEGSRWRQPH